MTVQQLNLINTRIQYIDRKYMSVTKEQLIFMYVHYINMYLVNVYLPHLCSRGNKCLSSIL